MRSTLLACLLLAAIVAADAQAQRRATPVTVRLATATPADAQPFAPTVTKAPTATSLGPTFLQAPQTAGNINVRAAPDLDSEVLGTIAYGALYPALRRYFQWYELRYEPSPNGKAWVYGELVEVSGDLSAIEIVEDFAEISAIPGVDAGLEAEQGGGTASAAGEPRVLIIATEAGGSAVQAAGRATPLPTYTYPADLPPFISAAGQESTAESAISADPEARPGLPPLLPILVLAGFGLVGLLINMIRA